MHLLITDAAPPTPNALHRLAGIELSHLLALLRLLHAEPARQESPETRNTLAEHLHAQALGGQVPDGRQPWAALLAQQNGLSSTTDDWALITPCHWKVHTDHVYMPDVDTLHLSTDDNAALLAAMRPYFAEDGIVLNALPDGQWLAQGKVFKGLASASLARASNARVDTWLPREPQARPLRRLQNEMQMLLYTHPVNDARAARGLPAINSFWVSGTGDLPANWQAPATPVKALRLARLGNAQAEKDKDPVDAWLDGWRETLATEVPTLLRLAEKAQDAKDTQARSRISLTLCGPQGARVFRLQERSAWTRMRQYFAKPELGPILSQL